MAKVETRTCDICNAPAKIIMSLYDTEFQKEINVSDICELHFNLIRSYIRHSCPPITKLPIDG